MSSYNEPGNSHSAPNQEFTNNNGYTPPSGNIPPVRPLPPKNSNHGCLLAVVFSLGFMAIIVFGGVMLINTGADFMNSVIDNASAMAITERETPYVEEKLGGEDTANRIAIIQVTGPIFGSGNSYYGTGMLYNLSCQLKHVAKDKTVKAVILHIDSPGGSVSASDIIYNEVEKLKKSGKKVIVYVGQLCASGGYYIASPADYIVASPTALVGSFGVIMQHVEVTGLLEKIGVVVDPLKSTDSKDIGSPFKKMTPEEKEYFDHILTAFHQRFIGIISKGRNLPLEQVAKLADGKVYLASEARDYGLIDEVGYFQSSLDEAKKSCTTDFPEIFTYKRQLSFMDFFTAQSDSQFPSIKEFLNENSGTELNLLYPGIQHNTSE